MVGGEAQKGLHSEGDRKGWRGMVCRGGEGEMGAYIQGALFACMKLLKNR